MRFLDDDLAREQLNTLNSAAQRLVQDLDRTLRDKEARLEEQKSQKEIKDAAGEVMDEEQRVRGNSAPRARNRRPERTGGPA